MSGPKISVVVPHLNQPEFLGACLGALVPQTVEGGGEVIVVDNGSRELPEAICAGFPGVRLADEATPGPGPARNHGISLARAPLLAFIDADCIAAPEWVAAILAAFDDPATQIIGGDVRIALSDPLRMTALEAYESVYAYRQKEYIERQGFSGTGNLAMRREAYARVGPFAGIGVAEDRDWGQRATAIGYAIAYVPQMIVFHPARKSMDELRVKWDRHTAHDYEEQVRSPLDRLKWLGKALALLLSPAGEVVRIARSRRISGFRDRLAAFGVLWRIRLHRARATLRELFAPRSAGASHAWNRD